MIPLKIQITNFLSYGPETQTIDFQNYSLICLSGKNGHGKSALLDAITWALWGQARKTGSTSKADQGLLHLGQHSMGVTFDFMCNGTQHRIKREYHHHYGKPYSVLEFGSINEQDGQEHAFTDKTIKTTQEAIEKVIRISYEAFINSAFLKQGQSNEFSKKSPKERKDILASVLGLELYETLRKRALEKTKTASLTRTHMMALQEKFSAEIKNKDTVTKELHDIKTKVAELSEQDTILKERLKQIYSDKDSLQKNAETLAADIRSYSLIQSQKNDLITTLEQLRHNRRQSRAALHMTDSIESLEAKKNQLNAELAIINSQTISLIEKKQIIIDLNNKKTALESNIRKNFSIHLEEKRHALLKANNEYTLTGSQTQKLYEQLQQTHRELQEKLVSISKFKTELDLSEKKIDQDTQEEKKIERKKEYYQKFFTRGTQLKAEYLEIEKKESMSLCEEDPSCPLCEQNLSAARRRFLKQKLFDRKNQLIHRIKRLGVVVKKLKIDIAEAEYTAQQRAAFKERYYQLKSTHEVFVQQHTTLQNQIISLEKQHESMQQEMLILQTAVSIKQKELRDYEISSESSLMNNPELLVLTEAITAATKETHSLEHITVTQKGHLAELTAIHARMEAYKIALLKKDVAQEIKRECSAVCKKIKEVNVALAALVPKINQKTHFDEQLKNLVLSIDGLNRDISQIQTEREQLLEKLGTTDATISKIRNTEKEYLEGKERLVSLEREMNDHTLLSAALGKEGIQALMIEEVIPEIEQEANYLLAKLTDNQSHISIDSLRDLKKGGAKETLDIKISDSVGIRPYEMFSGGEAFRIDFALRIAISKLLARRAGTSLQTLIIDEGFGSQDEEGLNNIMEAIHKIQEDFSKIIIVSHLPSMKDQFPVHFVIEKGSQGSTVKVIENG